MIIKQDAEYEIQRQFADNAQCKHIYFAACHDVGYVSELTPFINNKDRITLIRTYATHHEFAKLGLKMEDLPHIFRNNPLSTDQQAQQYQRPAANPPSPAPYSHPSSTSVDPTPEKICHFFNKGLCKYGSTCKNLHAKLATTTNGFHTASPSEGTDWRKDSKPNAPTSKSHNPKGGAAQEHPDFAALLPTEDAIPTNHIAINKNQQRLDYYVSPTSPEDRVAFASRVAHGKLCNNFHLKRDCPNGSDCDYDHQPITDGIRRYLTLLARNMPCPRPSACRLVQCTHGHICQKPDCGHRGGKGYCKIPMAMHTLDLSVAKYIPGTKASIKDNGDDENGIMNGRDCSWEKQRSLGSDAESENFDASTVHRDRKEDTSTAV